MSWDDWVNTLTGYWQDEHCSVSVGQKFISAVSWISIRLSDPICARHSFAKDKMVDVWTWLLDLHSLPQECGEFISFAPSPLWIAVPFMSSGCRSSAQCQLWIFCEPFWLWREPVTFRFHDHLCDLQVLYMKYIIPHTSILSFKIWCYHTVKLQKVGKKWKVSRFPVYVELLWWT